MSDPAPDASGSVLCIGIGNEYRHDDAAGLAASRALKLRAVPGTAIIEDSGEGASLMELWQDTNAVILIDAVQSGGIPGTIYRFEAHRCSMPARFFHYSTHAFSVAEAVEMARILGELPACLIVYGIEGEDFSMGVGLSLPVQTALAALVEQVAQEAEALSHSS